MAAPSVNVDVRVASGFVVSCLLVLACMTTAPTPNPTATSSPPPAATPTPCGPPSTCGVLPTPTVGPTTDTGFRTSILGLPVYTVAGINQLAVSGALDGRFAAVAGYWQQYALPCPYMAHQPPLSGFCNGGKFGDTPGSVEVAGGIDGGAPLAVTETSAGNVLWQIPGGPVGPSSQVALVVHAADARSWQCDPAQRAECASRLAIDRVAWAGGEELAMDQPDPNTAPADLHLTLDQVIAAAAVPGETVVLAYPLDAGSLNEVDPRFTGQGQGNLWYVRLISGAPDADGVAPGKDVLIDDATGTVVTTMPLSVDPAYSPARLVLDQNGYSGSGAARPRYEVSVDGRIVANNWLDSSSTPLALEVGAYDVRAYLGTETTDLGDTFSCEQPVALAGDVAYYADYANGGCIWKMGEWPFN